MLFSGQKCLSDCVVGKNTLKLIKSFRCERLELPKGNKCPVLIYLKHCLQE